MPHCIWNHYKRTNGNAQQHHETLKKSVVSVQKLTRRKESTKASLRFIIIKSLVVKSQHLHQLKFLPTPQS